MGNDMKLSPKREQYLLESWSDNIKAVESVDKDFSKEKALRLAQLLENTRTALDTYCSLSINEATNPIDVQQFKQHGFDLITAIVPNLIAEDIVSVQPLPLKVGQVFYLKYVFGSNKGKVQRGQNMFDSFVTSPGYENQHYSSEFIDEEVIEAGASKAEGNLDYTPVRPGTVVFNVDGVEVVDNGRGGVVAGGKVTAGTIDYQSGAFSLTLSGQPSSATASYYYDLENTESTIPQVDIKVEETIVTARPRKLKTLYAFDAAYDLKMAHGVDMDETLLTAAASEIRQEIDGEIMGDLYRQAGLTSTWNMKYNPTQMNISLREHYETFIAELTSAGNQMFQVTRRVTPNFLIVGKKAGDILETIGAPRFVAANTSGAIGPHFCGTLDGRIKVYKNPFYAENAYLLGYRGQSFVDAGYVYCPYLPLMTTQILMMEDFVGRRGYATSYGKKMLNNKLYIKGTITES